MIDFDLYVAGCAQALWFLGALALTLAPPQYTWKRELGQAGQTALMLGALALFALITLAIFPRVTDSEGYRNRAQDRVHRALGRRDPARGAELLSQAIEDFHFAASRNPLDPDTYFSLGAAYGYLWRAVSSVESAEGAYRALRRASALAPHRAGYHFRLGEILRSVARRRPSFVETHILPDYASAETPAGLPAALRPTFVEYRSARKLYPTKPSARLPEADLLWDLGLKGLARPLYREILAIDDQIHERWRNLKLNADLRQRVEARGVFR